MYMNFLSLKSKPTNRDLDKFLTNFYDNLFHMQQRSIFMSDSSYTYNHF